MKIFKFLLFFCMSLSAFGQNEQKEAMISKDTTVIIKKNNSYVTFSVSPTLFLVVPRWNFGYIHSVNEKVKIGITAGIGGTNFIPNT